MINRRGSWLISSIIILLSIAIFAVLVMTRSVAPSAPIKEREWRISTQIISPKKISPSLSLNGLVEASAKVNAAAPKSGRVANLYVKEGNHITKGQLLLELDDRDFKPKLLQAEAKVLELQGLIKSELSRFNTDKASLVYEQSIVQLEKASVQRAKQLKNKKLGSMAALEDAEESLKRQQLDLSNRKLAIEDHAPRLQQLKARLSQAEADVALAKLDLERSRLVAPFDGVIEKRFVSIGDQVKDHQVLLSYYATDDLELRAKIPAIYQSEIQHSINNKEHAILAQADYAGTQLQFRLDRLAGAADVMGIDALFSIEQGKNLIRPGSVLSLLLHRPAQTDTVVLPYSALYDNNQIYRVSDNRLEGLKIDIVGNYIVKGQEQILVRSDLLNDGDEILITHLPNAVNGLKVKTSQ